MNTYPTVPTTVRDITPLAIAIPFTIFCNMIIFDQGQFSQEPVLYELPVQGQSEMPSQ